MRYLLKRLYRERRRVVIVAVLAFASGAWAFRLAGGTILGLPPALAAGLAFMGGVTAFLMVIALLFPSYRKAAESCVTALLILSLFGFFSPKSPIQITESVWGIVGFVLCWLCFEVYAGPFLDRFLPRRRLRFRSHASSDLPPEKLAPYLMTSPEEFATFGADDLVSLDWVEPGKTLRVVSRIDGAAKLEEMQTLEVNSRPSHRAFRFEVVDAPKDATGMSGRFEISITPHENGSRIETSRIYDRATWRAMLNAWIDDSFGRLDDASVERAERGDIRGTSVPLS